MWFPICGDELMGGTNCTPHGAKFFIPCSQSLDILFDILTICQSGYHVSNAEIPFLFSIVPERADALVFENLQCLMRSHIQNPFSTKLAIMS